MKLHTQRETLILKWMIAGTLKIRRMKWVTNKALLQSTESAAQHPASLNEEGI